MRRLAMLVGFGGLLGGCALLVDFDGLTGGTLDGGAPDDAAIVDGASSSGGALHDSGDAATMHDGGEPDGDAAAPCAITRGGAMVSIELADRSFCIDATEVTTQQYAEFLAAAAGATTGQIGSCAWNTSYRPGVLEGEGCTTFDPATLGPSHPVTCVDWCDAYAFCSWAGKQLCGGLDGHEEAAANQIAGGSDRWTLACTHGFDGLHDYPYGATFDAQACVGAERSVTSPQDVGTATCQGGFPGVFDLVGNVHEWIDSCGKDGTDPLQTADHDAGTSNDACRTQGGSFKSTGASCEFYDPFDGRAGFRNDIGFRCCASP